jgi:hypothetical protein
MTTINPIGNGLSGTTGTGNFVGANTPTLITPVLGAATATSINFGGSTLNTYLTGTWTPALSGSGGGSATYVVQTGDYTQIGNRIFYNMYLVISASTLSGNITITGLPQVAGANFSASLWANNLGATATPFLTVLLQAGANYLSVWKYSAGSSTQLTATDIGTVCTFVITGSYHV